MNIRFDADMSIREIRVYEVRTHHTSDILFKIRLFCFHYHCASSDTSMLCPISGKYRSADHNTQQASRL